MTELQQRKAPAGTERDVHDRARHATGLGLGVEQWQDDADLLAALATAPVSDVMDTRPLVVPADASASAVAGVLVDRGVGGAPVVDGDGRIVGFVCARDLLCLQDDLEGDTGGRSPGHALDRRCWKLGGMVALIATAPVATVREVMTRSPLVVGEHVPVGRAMALMAYRGVHRVPVVDDAQRVVGTVGAVDVLRWLGERAGWAEVYDASRAAGARPDRPTRDPER